MSRQNDCTCRMDGSFRLSCPQHGKRNTLISKAQRVLLKLTDDELESFLADVGELLAQVGRGDDPPF